MFDITCAAPWSEMACVGGRREERLCSTGDERFFGMMGWPYDEETPAGPSSQCQNRTRSPFVKSHSKAYGTNYTDPLASGARLDPNRRIMLTEDSMELCRDAPMVSSCASEWGCSNLPRIEPVPLHTLHDTRTFGNVPEASIGPPPLGLKLRKSNSLINLISGELQNTQSMMPVHEHDDECTLYAKDFTASNGAVSPKHDADGCGHHGAGRVKASNFPATSIHIGDWSYHSQNEGDVVAKFYYAKKKIVWEILLEGLKDKIEFNWNDILDIEMCEHEERGRIEVLLSKVPTFSQESDPQPRKHTLWRACKDFTDNQASTCKRHVLYFEAGILKKHKQKLMECDSRLCSILASSDPNIAHKQSNPAESDLVENLESMGQGKGEEKTSCSDDITRYYSQALNSDGSKPEGSRFLPGSKHSPAAWDQLPKGKKKKLSGFQGLEKTLLPVSTSCISFESNFYQQDEVDRQSDALWT